MSVLPPSPSPAPPVHDMRKQRSDGAEARARLPSAALWLFSEKGFAKTSTRDIAQSAGANLAQQFTRLHFREMLKPKGLWAEQIDSSIKPAHAALAMQMFISRDVIDAVRPQLIATPRAIDLWASRLVDFAEAMVALERGRRQSLAPLREIKA